MNALKEGLENIRELCKRNVPDKHAQWAIERTYVKALLELADWVEEGECPRRGCICRSLIASEIRKAVEKSG